MHKRSRSRWVAESLAIGLGLALLLRHSGAPLLPEAGVDAQGQLHTVALVVALDSDSDGWRDPANPHLADNRSVDGALEQTDMAEDSTVPVHDNGQRSPGPTVYLALAAIPLLLAIWAFRRLKHGRRPPPATRAANTGTVAAAAGSSQGAQDSGELPSHVLQLGYSVSGQQFSYLPQRNLKLSLALTALGMLLATAGSLLHAIAGTGLPFALLLIVAGIGLFLYGIVSLGHHRDITISAERIRITNRYFGLARNSDIAVAEITGIGKRSEERAHAVAYSIHLYTRDGSEIRIGDNLPDSRIADYLVAQIRNVAHIPAGGRRSTRATAGAAGGTREERR